MYLIGPRTILDVDPLPLNITSSKHRSLDYKSGFDLWQVFHLLPFLLLYFFLSRPPLRFYFYSTGLFLFLPNYFSTLSTFISGDSSTQHLHRWLAGITSPHCFDANLILDVEAVFHTPLWYNLHSDCSKHSFDKLIR